MLPLYIFINDQKTHFAIKYFFSPTKYHKTDSKHEPDFFQIDFSNCVDIPLTKNNNA